MLSFTLVKFKIAHWNGITIRYMRDGASLVMAYTISAIYYIIYLTYLETYWIS